MSTYDVSLAGPQDDAQLRAAMAAIWMEGRMAVSFRREPSYFRGCLLQGDKAHVIKCTERRSGRIVGMGSRLRTRQHVNGVLTEIGYLADLRGALHARNGTLLARGFRLVRSLHALDPLPFYFTVVFDGNEKASEALEGGRAGLPIYRPLGRLLTPAIHLDFARPAIDVPGVCWQRGDEAMMPAITAFLRRMATRRQFSPAYADIDFAPGGRFAGVAPGDFFVALKQGEILGCLAAWDQSDIRQTHIERYPPVLAALRPLYNAAARVLPLKPLPAAGERVPYLYACCIAVRDDDLPVFHGLLRHAYNVLRNGPWHYVIAGLHETDPLAQVLGAYRSIAAAGRLYSVHYPEDGDPAQWLDDRVPYVEMALA